MSTKSFDAYFKAFKDDYARVVDGMKPYHVFTAFCAQYFYYADSSENIDEDFRKCMPDGANDGGCDAIFVNPLDDSNELVVLQGKFYKKSALGLQELKSELNKIIDTLTDLRNRKSGNLNAALSAAYFPAVSDLEDGFGVRIDFCTLASPKGAVLKQMQQACREREEKTGYHIRLLTREDIMRRVVSCETSAETVGEYTLNTDKPDNALWYHDSAVVNISAQSLQSLYLTHHNKVLGRNLRYYIKSGAQSKNVDGAIARTISEEPNNFWYLNNGILIACDDFKLTGTKLWLKNFSIVNGGQTTYKVAKAKDLSNDFYIQCKVVKTIGSSETERSKFCLKIANSTNAQKPIKQADLRSNEPEQMLLKKKLAALNFYYVTKAGDKPQKKVYKNYQITNLDRVGKAVIAGQLLMPGTSRSGATKMFDDDFYKMIFEDALPNVITDLLTLIYYFKDYQRKALAHPEALNEDQLPVVKNGEKYYIACIGFFAKIKAKAFTYEDFNGARKKGLDNVRPILWRNGGLQRIINAKGDVREKAGKVFSILTKMVLARCCKQARQLEEKRGGNFVHTNYLKKDQSFVEDIVDELWTQYCEYDAFKQAVDDLIG